MTEVAGPVESPLHTEWQQTTALYEKFRNVINRQPNTGFNTRTGGWRSATFGIHVPVPHQNGHSEVFTIDTGPTQSHRLFPRSLKEIDSLSEEDKDLIRRQPAFSLYVPIVRSSQQLEIFAGIPQSLRPDSIAYRQLAELIEQDAAYQEEAQHVPDLPVFAKLEGAGKRILKGHDPFVQRLLSTPLT